MILLGISRGLRASSLVLGGGPLCLVLGINLEPAFACLPLAPLIPFLWS